MGCTTWTYEESTRIPCWSHNFQKYTNGCFFFLPWLLYWGHVTIIHWQSYPRMNCSDSTSPNPSSKSWIFILFLLPRIQLQHLAVAMLLASCKKRSLQHVGCLPKKSHRNLADVCSGKNKTRARRVPELCEEKHPKHHGCFGASLKHQRCLGIVFKHSNHPDIGWIILDRQMCTLHSSDLLGDFCFQVMFESVYHD